MNRAVCLLALVPACATPIAATPRCPPTLPSPRCPSPLVTSCPPLPTPSCPPLPPEPEARDWSCMELRGASKKKDGGSYCWVSEALCQKKRVMVRKERLGTATACTRQRVAYCMQSVATSLQLRQLLCMASQESCEEVREELLKETPPGDSLTDCRPRLNIDPYDTPKDFEPYRPPTTPADHRAPAAQP